MTKEARDFSPLEEAKELEAHVLVLTELIEKLRREVLDAKTFINDPTLTPAEQDAWGSFILNFEEGITNYSSAKEMSEKETKLKYDEFYKYQKLFEQLKKPLTRIH